MGANSSIEWTHHTFNPWWGCARVSPGCEHCYAETFAKRVGFKVWGAQSDRRQFGDAHWNEPLKWNRDAARAGERRRVFCASMADVFEDRRDLDAHRARLWSLIAVTPNLDWLLLTKRPENMLRLAPAEWAARWPTNAWAGTTVEDQRRADERVPHLVRVPAGVRFLSAEPLLGPINLKRLLGCSACDGDGYFGGGYDPETGDGDIGQPCPENCQGRPAIHWVIVGGESGHGARPCALEWIEDIVERCRAAGAAPFVKQLGARPFTTNANLWNDLDGDVLDGPPPDGEQGSAASGVRLRDRKGGDIAEFPIRLRVREFPSVR